MSTFSYKLINEESVSAVTATPSVQVGTRRLADGREYIYAYNDGGIANKGAPVIMTAVSGYSFVKTYATAADTSVAFLGILHNATCAAGSYAWVCTRGVCDAYCDANAVIAGDNLTIVDGGGAFRVYTYTSSLTQIVAAGVMLRALGTLAGTASGPVAVLLR